MNLYTGLGIAAGGVAWATGNFVLFVIGLVVLTIGMARA